MTTVNVPRNDLTGDLYQLLLDIQNGISAPGHRAMANSAIRKIDKALASEQPSEGDVGRDEARLALFRAIEAIKIGNKTDDKLILDELQKAGYRICRLQNANTSREVTTECNAALSPGVPVAWPDDKCGVRDLARTIARTLSVQCDVGEDWLYSSILPLLPPANDETAALLRDIIVAVDDAGEKHGRIAELDALIERAEHFLANQQEEKGNG